jgi:hypothetical protein
MRGRVTVGGLARTGSPTTSSPLSSSSRRYSICRTDRGVFNRVADPDPDPHGSAFQQLPQIPYGTQSVGQTEGYLTGLWIRIRIHVDLHYFWKLDPNPHYSEKLDPE